MKKYYLIRTDDKGFSTVQVMAKPALEKFLKTLLEDEEDADDIVKQFLLPVSPINLAYQSNTYMLIHGEAIRPAIAETVTKLTV